MFIVCQTTSCLSGLRRSSIDFDFLFAQTSQAGLAAPFVPYQSMPPGVALPVNPGLQPMCNLPAGAPAPAPVAPASSAGTGGNPTLLQSRPAPKKEAKEETKRAAQGRALTHRTNGHPLSYQPFSGRCFFSVIDQANVQKCWKTTCL